MGLLGPILRAEVGDTIKVVFKNNASRPYSVHPHGVFYEKASEGSMYADNVPDEQKTGDMVPPGATFTYEWEVPERAGPGPEDPSSIVWVYHSHVNEYKDVASGLVGAIVVTRRGQANSDGTPKDVDREIVALFTAFNENQSWYVQENVAAHISAADQKTLNKTRRQTFRSAHVRHVHGQRICRDQLQVFHQWIPLRQRAGDDHESRASTCAGICWISAMWSISTPRIGKAATW